MGISEEFQNRFKEFVEELGEKNRTVAAKEIGISYLTFSKAYNYGIIPRPSILVKIADFFQTSIEYLLGKTENDYFEKSDCPRSFKERLEELKEAKNLTVYELSKRIHIHRNNIAQWLNKEYMPTLEDLEIIADYFAVSLDYLLGRTDYKK